MRDRIGQRYFVVTIIFILGLLGLSSGHPANAQEPLDAAVISPDFDNETCFACHGDPESEMYIDAEKYSSSVHARNLCIACHRDIKEVPHDSPLKPVSCASCHRIESEVYLKSDHGKFFKAGMTEAATCKSCHGNPHELTGLHDSQSPVYRANIPQTCGQCHEKTEEMKKFKLNQPEPVASYIESVHGLALKRGELSAAVCTDCHGSHDLSKVTNSSSKLHWRNIPKTCGKCHENVYLTYSRSIHGQAVADGIRESPVCTDCHGEHSIDAIKLLTSKVSPAHIPETCGECHGAERITTKYQLPDYVVETYMESYHGLAVKRGSATVAHCASCHGVHDILPSEDPRSSINPKNLENTCGKCHVGVSEQVAYGKIHSGRRPGLEDRISGFVRKFYTALILIVIGLMLVHNFLDFLKKLRAHYLRLAESGRKPRMGTSERVQHMILALTFIGLAYTGFALKYPEAWWASPFMGRTVWRSLGHRFAAFVFCALSVYHIWFMFFTRKGRWQLKALCPRRLDLIQLGQTFAYYLGFRKDRPVPGFYGYVEKMEYWALVWGSSIMVITGALMIPEAWFMKHFPKWFFDVISAIHYYEAILACLAILIWHGYFVIFDPDEYPMKWTWVDGRSSPADDHRSDGDHPSQS